MEKYRDNLFDEVATLSIMQPSLSHDGNVTGYRMIASMVSSANTWSHDQQKRKSSSRVEVSKLEEKHVRLTIEGRAAPCLQDQL
ncbi:hypothetical protein HU200_048898 [Digitaria exilis]|uniref:Uncharacterized protein n=1 Tax=Digitaria exilis TaxID=1010633 RepID=A0A835AUU2_9POAL|nr:hypothetical protein HU200_048898 [Digitaria exilis]